MGFVGATFAGSNKPNKGGFLRSNSSFPLSSGPLVGKYVRCAIESVGQPWELDCIGAARREHESDHSFFVTSSQGWRRFPG